MADEQRLNRIEEKLDSVVKESSELRGEIRQFMSNSTSYIGAVSANTSKVKVSLDEHKEDMNAHGMGVKKEIDGKFLGWVAIGATVLSGFGGVIGGAVHKLMSAK